MDKKLLCVLFDTGVASTQGDSMQDQPLFCHALTIINGHHSPLDQSHVTITHHCQESDWQLTRDRTMCMVRAIEAKDIESIKTHIHSGADLTLGLAAALLIHDSEALQLLLAKEADVIWIFPAKTRSALMDAIDAGEREFVDFILKFGETNALLQGIDFVLDGRTLLTAAVSHSFTRIAQALMQKGADPTLAIGSWDSFTKARENSFGDMLEILLRGARIFLVQTSVAIWIIP